MRTVKLRKLRMTKKVKFLRLGKKRKQRKLRKQASKQDTCVRKLTVKFRIFPR